MEEINLGNKFYLYNANSSEYVIFVHGMVETFEGYLKIKDYLVENNLNVVLYNQRAHGLDGDLLAHYNSNDSYSLVNDLMDIYTYLNKEKNATSISVVGHSMGTYVIRSAMKALKFDKVVLNGMPKSNNMFTTSISSLLFLGNARKRTKVFNKVVFNSYNKRFKDSDCEYSWVCSNSEYLESYLNSKYCGVVGTKGFYREIIKLSYLASEKNLISTDVMLTSGSEDPVSEFGDVCDTSAIKFKKCGCSVTIKKYNNMRHFIYDEVDCLICYEDLLKFLRGWVQYGVDYRQL